MTLNWKIPVLVSNIFIQMSVYNFFLSICILYIYVQYIVSVLLNVQFVWLIMIMKNVK